MRYDVYTDGSCMKEKSKSASAYLIKTDTKFIHHGYQSFKSIFIVYAEINAVCLALNYIMKSGRFNSAEDEFTFYIDSRAALEKCLYFYENDCRLRDAKFEYDKLAFKTMKAVKEKGFKLDLKKVRGHQEVMNPNKYVDRLVKYALVD